MFQKLTSEKGFSLVMVMVALALAGIVAVIISKTSRMSRDLVMAHKQLTGIQFLRRDISALLGNSATCESALLNKELKSTGTGISLKTPSGSVFLSRGRKIDGWKVTSLRVYGFAVLPNAGNLATVQVKIKRVTPVTQTKTLEFFVKVILNGSKRVSSCQPSGFDVVGGYTKYIDQGTGSFIDTKFTWGLATAAGSGACPTGAIRQTLSLSNDSVSPSDIGDNGIALGSGTVRQVSTILCLFPR